MSISRKIVRPALFMAMTLLPSAGVAQDEAARDTARAFIEPFLNGPTEFPVTEPLAKRPDGLRIAIVDCGSPICGLFAEIATQPAELLGMSVTRFRSGTSADGVATAFDSILAEGFDGVFVPALAPSLWDRYLRELNEGGIPVVTTGIIGLDPELVRVAGAATPTSTLSGQILANWTVAGATNGGSTVFYNTPQLSFSNLIGQVFVSTMAEICPDCDVRMVDIPVTAFGSSAPAIVVDDLLAHPDTETAVFAVGEQAIGLPSALTTANITVRTALNSPDPSVLAQIQDGTYDMGMGVDLPVLTWTLIDSLARLMTGQEPADLAVRDQIVRQILTQDNLKGDVSHGWTGYPDFADRFQTLWADAQ